MKKLLVSVTICTLMACHTSKPIQINNVDSSASRVTIQYQEKIKDSLIYIPADSSWITALLACDSNGNVLLKQLESYRAGKNIQPPKIILQNNLLSSFCNVDSSTVYLRWKEHYMKTDSSTLKNKTVTITLPAERINYVTWWQRLFITSGKIAWGLLITFGLYKLLKSRLKFL